MNKNVLICPVCQKTVFEHMYSYEICRYCGWENDNYFEEGGANGLSFEEYKKRYQQYLEEDPNYLWDENGFPEI